FALYLGQALVSHVLRRRPAGVEDLLRQLLVAFFAGLAGYVLLREDYRPWLGTFSLLGAAGYTALVGLALPRGPARPLQLVWLSAALALIAVVFPLETETAWVALGWATEGLALWWFGLRIRNGVLRGFALALFALAVGRLLVIDTPRAAEVPRWLLLNG